MPVRFSHKGQGFAVIRQGKFRLGRLIVQISSVPQTVAVFFLLHLSINIIEGLLIVRSAKFYIKPLFMALIQSAVRIPVKSVLLHRLLIIADGLCPRFLFLTADTHAKVHLRMVIDIFHRLILDIRFLILSRIPIKIPQHQTESRHLGIHRNGLLHLALRLLFIPFVPEQ